MKMTTIISIVVSVVLIGFMTDPVWEAMADWQRQAWIISLFTAFMSLGIVFCVFIDGHRPVNYQKLNENYQMREKMLSKKLSKSYYYLRLLDEASSKFLYPRDRYLSTHQGNKARLEAILLMINEYTHPRRP